MDEQQEQAAEAMPANVDPATLTGRRDFIARLAKAAVLPAVVAGIAANVSPAHAY